MPRRSLTAIGVGIAVLWLTQWRQSDLLRLLAPMLKAPPVPLWPAMALNVLFAVVALLPGFCAGWIAGERGILVGLLTGFIGSLGFSVLSALMQYPFGALDAGSMLVWFAGWGLGLTLTCAAGGATGQLLRRSKRENRS
jgi:hypothetical protein